MSKLRVNSFSISIDGYSAGPNQSLENPLCVGGLEAQLIDEMHIAISPILLGSGESLFSKIDLTSLGYQCIDHVATDNAIHVIIKKGV